MRLRTLGTEIVTRARDWKPGEREALSEVIADGAAASLALAARRSVWQEEFARWEAQIHDAVRRAVKKRSAASVLETLDCAIEYDTETKERLLVFEGQIMARRPMQAADEAEAAALIREKTSGQRDS